MRQQRERQERRSAQGNRAGAVANQASILLGRRKNSAEQSAGKLQQQHSAAKEQLALRIRAAQQQIAQDAPIALQAPVIHTPTSRRVVQLHEVTLPFAPAATRYINLVLHGQQRVGVSGANGCGKSTLLKVLAGQCLPLAGECQQAAGAVYLDQQLANLNPERSCLRNCVRLMRLPQKASCAHVWRS